MLPSFAPCCDLTWLAIESGLAHRRPGGAETTRLTAAVVAADMMTATDGELTTVARDDMMTRMMDIDGVIIAAVDDVSSVVHGPDHDLQ